MAAAAIRAAAVGSLLYPKTPALRITSPLRYSPSGNIKVVGWSGALSSFSTSAPSTCASIAAPATILWKRSALMPPEHEKVNSKPPGANSLSARRLMSL